MIKKYNLKQAVKTTLVQLPLILWQYMLISIYITDTIGASWSTFSQSTNLIILAFMLVVTFITTLTTKRIHKYKYISYWLIFGTFGTAILFDNSWLAQFGLFLVYIGFMVYPFKENESKGKEIYETKSIEMPLWLRLKKEEFDDVNFSNNKVDEIIKLTNDEFNEFLNSCNKNNGLLLTYLSTLSDEEIEKFYTYLQKEIKYNSNMDYVDYKVDFEKNISSIDKDEITDIQRKRATLEMPLMINFSKSIYHKINSFMKHTSKNYFENENSLEYRKYEIPFTNILWDNMTDIPTHFEEVVDALQKYYNENNKEHQEFMKHISQKLGHLILVLDLLIQLTQDKRKSSFSWFVDNFMMGIKLDGFEIYKNDPLTFHTTNMYMGIVEQNDNAYLSSLISVVETLFEYYPVNRPACENAMVEMIKIVATKKINDVEVANRFLTFFENLPRVYDELTFDRIIELKNIIGYHISNYKPHENIIFNDKKAKNTTILLNYLIDVEDLYYENKKEE